MNKKKPLFLVGFWCLLLAFTAYVLLDTFVIVRRMQIVAQPETIAAASPEESAATVGAVTLCAAAADEEKQTVVTESSYEDGNISVVITE